MEDRKRKFPIGALVLAVIVGLGGVGLSYGLWSQVLTIQGTVHTGEVDARWLYAGCFEFNSWPAFPTQPGDYGEVEGKEVGWWSVLVDPADDHILRFAIHNGYPSYAVDCEVHFEVQGTIPVIMRGMQVVPGAGLSDCTVEETPDGSEQTLRCDELTVVFTDNQGVQLHPGGHAASSLTAHVEQAAAENQGYEFGVLLCMAQWNEEATAAECFAGR